MPETERKRREDKIADARFEREEMGELLKLFSALGITVSVGIVGAFFAGMRIDAWLAGAGWETYGAGKFIGLFLGLGFSVYWAYLRIAKHLKKFEKPPQ
jgi:carbon starvation protein CstA